MGVGRKNVASLSSRNRCVHLPFQDKQGWFNPTRLGDSKSPNRIHPKFCPKMPPTAPRGPTPLKSLNLLWHFVESGWRSSIATAKAPTKLGGQATLSSCQLQEHHTACKLWIAACAAWHVLHDSVSHFRVLVIGSV